jgi:hypothetical protein
MRAVSKGGLNMRCNLTQNGEESFGERREIPIGSSRSVEGRNLAEPRGEGSTKFPDVPLLENVTITISVTEGRSKGLTYQLKKLCITVGRIAGGADFEFNEPEASEVHCFIAARSHSVRLYASPSAGNIYVNDQPIRTVELMHASTFRVGSSLLRVTILPNQLADIRKGEGAEN